LTGGQAQVGNASAAVTRGSLAESVDLVLARLPRGLCPPQTSSRIRAAAANVPATFVARYGFEYRLGDDGSGPDFLFSVDSATGGLEAVAASGEQLAPTATWKPVVRFCRRRSETAAPLAQLTDHVWVEFDTGSGAHAGDTPPSVFFGLQPDRAPKPAHPHDLTQQLLERGFEVLLGEPLPEATATTVRAVVGHLPSQTRIFQAGAMLARPRRGIRLCIENIGRAETIDLVSALRGDAEAAGVRTVIDELVAPDVSVCPSLDVGPEGVGPRLGLELHNRRDGTVEEIASRWRSSIARLAAAGLCTPRRRNALLACYGVLSEAEGRHWPRHLAEASSLLGKDFESILGYHIHHLKLVVEHGVPVETKAYVVVWPGWRQ
jgi:hypothetical protein